ncbi:dirigent protein 21 [Cajanus cajan]|uniref:Dirigent protein n=1 Tax=Cajanus cajan TaxID=3821 RepID=A0A151REX2_CAJCA|nr:dirigent protein 21 [Cajanus cajan]KYP41071.1 Disease resistance response protein 206 family [Cajanus cajan]
MGLPHALFLLFSLTLSLISTHASFSHQSHIELPSHKQHCAGKLTHIHFFYHDIRNDNSPSIVQIVETPKNVPNGFGSTFVMDDVMTEGPELGSKRVGRAQGLFGLASLEDLGMFMLTNFAFTHGHYAGSTLSMLGRNPITDQNREMPIVGGTGAFRFATGYAIANSLHSISTPDHFVVEYNITVRHSSWDH